MRFGKKNYAIMYKVDTQNPEAPLTYHGVMRFEANFSKFTIKFDEISGKYYSIATRLHETPYDFAPRNLLSLMSSADLKTWEVVCDLHDYRHCDPRKVGLQYVDFEFENNDIIYLCRTAINNADDYHNSNYQTFHRITDFRKL